jgi:hypothetical protein
MRNFNPAPAFVGGKVKLRPNEPFAREKSLFSVPGDYPAPKL